MKMSDYFDLPVRPSQLEVYGANSNEGISFDEIESAAAHAINNHDLLVEENAKLREALLDLIECNGILTSDKECVINAKKLLKDQNNDK